MARPMKPVSIRTSHDITTDYTNHHNGGIVTEGPPDTPSQQSHSNMGDRGYVGGRSAPVTTFAWISAIKMGSKREGSSGPASGGESADPSRRNSRSRPSSVGRDSESHVPPESRKSTETKDKTHEDHREGDMNQSLQDEYVEP